MLHDFPLVNNAQTAAVRNRPYMPQAWNPITSTDGRYHGEYEVSGGMLTVRYAGRQKTTGASKIASANTTTARIMLMEMVREDEARGRGE